MRASPFHKCGCLCLEARRTLHFQTPGICSHSCRTLGRVEDGRGCSGRLRRLGPVSRPRSSNRTCGFPASGSPTGFLPQAVASGGPRCIRRRRSTPNWPNTTWSLNRRAPRDDTFLRLRKNPRTRSHTWLSTASRRVRPPSAEWRTPPAGTSLSALRSPFADMPCPLPRRTEPGPMSVASRLVRPSPYLRPVGVRDFPFEACSGLLRVTACRLARPALPGLCHQASARPITRPSRSSASMPTDNCMGGFLSPTGCPRRKGALRNAG